MSEIGKMIQEYKNRKPFKIKWIEKNDFHEATVDDYRLEITKAFDLAFGSGLQSGPEYYSATVRKLKPIPERWKTTKTYGRYKFVKSFKCKTVKEARKKLEEFII